MKPPKVPRLGEGGPFLSAAGEHWDDEGGLGTRAEAETEQIPAGLSHISRCTGRGREGERDLLQGDRGAKFSK